MKKIDLTKNFDASIQRYFITTLTVGLFLSRDEMCEALKHDVLILNDDSYSVPKEQLSDNIKNGKYNEVCIYKLIKLMS